MDRRDFIGRGTRLAALGVMALVTGLLVSRRQITLKRECGRDYLCGKCTRLNSCKLPEAEIERENIVGNEKG